MPELTVDADWIRRTFDTLARGSREDLKSYLDSVGAPVEVSESGVRIRTHWLPFDGNSRPRLNQLAERLAEETMAYCIPRSRIEEALDHAAATGSPNRLSRLEREARDLFVKAAGSGEGGELLLYSLLESSLGIPQILCKMALKTSSNMHIHGVDGVHAQFTDRGNLAIYWGESKVWATFNAAMSACFESVKAFLTDDGTGALNRDMLLARDNLDVRDRDLTLELVKYFDNDQPQSQNVEMRAACLIGFGLDEYASPFDGDGALTRETIVQIENWVSAIKTRTQRLGISEFVIEIFCIPFPSAEEFRVAMMRALGQ
ncbi:MAG TPA: DUF1837 domain-containing protein [Lacisediminihabitans sp.]|nr:DUF1837 domain-containing protein [Lacisediminihabitans sp.]HXD60920.1 DUF1837 domain-containing protein [Lacisediminihabitans sp.]